MLLDQLVGGDITLTFSTPIMIRRIEGAAAFNPAVEHMLLAREKSEPALRTGGQQLSSVGGWRSEAKLWSWPDPELQPLRQAIVQATAYYLGLANGLQNARLKFDGGFTAWAIVNRDGQYNVPHSHPEHAFSGVYYVATGRRTGNNPLNGAIQFQDPRGGALFGPVPGFDFGVPYTIVPEPGMLVIFPSWLIHYVHPFQGQGARIAVAFNLKLNRLEFLPP